MGEGTNLGCLWDLERRGTFYGLGWSVSDIFSKQLLPCWSRWVCPSFSHFVFWNEFIWPEALWFTILLLIGLHPYNMPIPDHLPECLLPSTTGLPPHLMWNSCACDWPLTSVSWFHQLFWEFSEQFSPSPSPVLVVVLMRIRGHACAWLQCSHTWILARVALMVEVQPHWIVLFARSPRVLNLSLCPGAHTIGHSANTLEWASFIFGTAHGPPEHCQKWSWSPESREILGHYYDPQHHHLP